MEKQPVDDLFARKLRGNEVNVNPDAFARLQRRMGVKEMPQKKAHPVWRYAAAACFFGALAIGYVISTKEITTISGQDKVVRYAGKELHAPEKTSKTERLAANVLEKKTKTEANTARLSVAGYVKPDLSATAHKNRKAIESLSHSLGDQSKSIATIESVEQIETLSTNLESATARQPLQVLSAQKFATDRTVVLTISEPQLTAQKADESTSSKVEDTKRHGFSGLLGKIRQLKNGETFARATTSSGKITTPFGRTLTELKETLKNETTIDQ